MDRNLAFGTVKLQPLTFLFFVRGVSGTFALLLCALAKASLESLDQVLLKFLRTKTALLSDVSRTVGDLSALSVALSCLRIQGEGSLAVLPVT